MPDTRMDSEGVKSPITRFSLPNIATKRLCIRSSNSTRMFLPSTLADSAAKPGRASSASATTSFTGACFIQIRYQLRFVAIDFVGFHSSGLRSPQRPLARVTEDLTKPAAHDQFLPICERHRDDLQPIG